MKSHKSKKKHHNNLCNNEPFKLNEILKYSINVQEITLRVFVKNKVNFQVPYSHS